MDDFLVRRIGHLEDRRIQNAIPCIVSVRTRATAYVQSVLAGLKLESEPNLYQAGTTRRQLGNEPLGDAKAGGEDDLAMPVANLTATAHCAHAATGLQEEDGHSP